MDGEVGEESSANGWGGLVEVGGDGVGHVELDWRFYRSIEVCG